ncbi:MAG: sulfatase [Prolixibacteraceae bacterium]
MISCKSSGLFSGIVPAILTIFSPFSTLQAQEKQEKIHPQRPNIIWISTEDIGPHLGCYGDQAARTPNLDRLAKQGMRFNNVFTSAAICAPCRAGIITGMYQTSIGCMHMRTTSYRRNVDHPIEFTAVPPHYVKAFTEYLRTSGYYCTNNAKTDYQFAKDPVPASIWDECGKKASYKNRPDKNQPFFAVINYEGTHESKNWNIENVKTDPKSVIVPPYYPDNEIVRRNLAKLYDNIARLDTLVGKMMADLEKEGLADNTIIFFWGDHGDGLPRAKRWLYDSGLQIPLIIKWPGEIMPGSVNDEMISSIDFGPTVLSMAGVKIPSHMQGKAFLGKQKDEPRQFVFGARDRVDESYDMVRSVRSKDFLYIRNFYPNQSYNIWIPYLNKMPIMQEMLRLDAEGKLNKPQQQWMANTRPPEELYDVKADPYQINNLADQPEYKNKLAEMREKQNEWTIETADMGHLNEPEMIGQMWPGGKQPITDKPWFTVNAPEDRASQIYQTGGTYSSPMTLGIYCPTHGASLVYSLDSAENQTWKLYSGPLNLEKGTHKIRIKAVRYGYKDSDEIPGTFTIK